MRKILIVAVAALTLGGCGINDMLNESRGRGDAPVSRVDDAAKEVIQFPDRFANVAHACDGHGHRVFVTTRTEAGMQLEVVDDESCARTR